MKKRSDICCPNCGKLFHPSRPSSKFCCRACGIQYNKEHGVMKKTEEQKKKISEAHMGKEPWNKGKTASKEQIEKFRISIAKVWTKEKREEHRCKQKEIWSNPDLIAKHSEIMAKSHESEETRAKIAEAIHNYNKTITDEQWKDRYLKSFQTKTVNGTLFASTGENEIKKFVESLGFKTTKMVIGKGNSRFEIDIYIEDKKLGIEYNGAYYHSTNGVNRRARSYHFNKNTIAYTEGIELIQVWEDQWKNQTEIIKDIIAARLGIIRGEKVYARECEIREVSTKDYREFCIKNHIQGYRSASVKIGLYHNNVLVQIASFNKARQYSIATANVYDWEWVRGCISSNNKVIGGTSKLLTYFIKTYNPDNILCFSDWNLFNGNGYEKAGFNFEGFTGPDKFYITINSKMTRINRNPYTYKQYSAMVKEGKLFECYGCGSKKYVWTKS